MRSLSIFLLAVLALPAHAQTGSLNASPETFISAQASYSFALSDPLTAPCTIVLNPRQPLSFSDSQKNTFTTFGKLSYSTSCSSGADSITVSCPNASPCWAQVSAAVYPGALTPDQQSPMASGSGTSALSASITPSQNGATIVGFGYNDSTNSPGITAGTGFNLHAVANAFLEDFTQATAGPVSGTATYSGAVNWQQGVASFLSATPPPAPQLINTKINTSLFWCTKCDNSAGDNVPMSGNLVISQNGTTSSWAIGADGSVSINLAINVATDPADFVFFLTDANGVAQRGTLEWKLSQAQIQSNAGFMLGTLGLPGLKFTKATDASGNPFPVFKGFTTP